MSVASPLSLILFGVGVPIAFAGWRLYETMLMLTGGVAGMGLGVVTGVYLAGPGYFQDPLTSLPTFLAGLGFVGGVATAIVAHRLVHGLTGFVIAAGIGYVTVNSVGVAVVLGLFGGYATWVLHKVSVIVLTSIFGGVLVSFGVGLQDSVGTQVVLVTLVAVAGMTVQFNLFGIRSEHEEQAADSMRTACPGCGHPCKSGDAYCYECGADLRWCGSCGRVGLSEWAYCNDCGNALEQG